MATSSLLYVTGALMEGWLAAMLFVCWRVLRASGARWPGLLAAAFACNAVRCSLLATGYGNVTLDKPASPGTSVLATLTMALLTSALIDYVALGKRLARRLNAGATLLIAVTLAAIVFKLATRGEAFMVVDIFVLGWIGLFVGAAIREPRSGHVLVIVALLAFPVGNLAARAGWWPFELLAAIEIVPLSAIGLTVLTAGLLRAHRRALRETAVAGGALAERERAHAALRAANGSLEQRVQMRTQELHETIAGLESFNRSVSHDLRGPLGGISGLARLARDELADGHPAEADRLLAAIAKQAGKSVDLVGALLALARAGDAEPKATQFALAPVVLEAIAALGDTVRSSSVRIDVGPLPEVWADRDLLRQVFVNLIGNACKFAAGARQPRVEVGSTPTPAGDAFYVRDNGVGFEPAAAAGLFKPFQRLHGAGFEGTGVGLSIVRRIVTHHGGRVWAEGAPHGGATFWFTLGDAARAAA